MRGRHPAPPPPRAVPQGVRNWVHTPKREHCRLTAPDRKRMASQMLAAMQDGVAPLQPGMTPVVMVVVGTPGSGKTTVARTVARGWYGADGRNHFVDVDLDDAINFHPQGPALWNLRDAATGEALPVGSTETFFLCRDEAIEVMREVVRSQLLASNRPRYSLVLYRNKGASVTLRAAKRLGWHTVLLYVGVPREVATRRAHDRGPRQGRFFSAEDVAYWYAFVHEGVAFWALAADEFLLVDNRRDRGDTEPPPVVRRVAMHGDGNWEERLRAAQEAVDAVSPPPDRSRTQRDRTLLAGLLPS